MFDVDNMVDMIIDNVKKLFFPEEWINLDLKFSKSEIFTLLYLDRKKEVTMTELVAYINSPMSTATGIVDRLVKNGYVLRDRSETDRRIVILKLTQDGARLIGDLKNMISDYIDTIVRDLTEEEKKLISKILFKIMNSLQAKWTPQSTDIQDTNSIKEINIE